MKFLERVLIVLACIGLFIKVMMWHGGEIFLTFSLPSLAVIYLLMSWKIFKHKEDGHHVVFSFLSGLPFSILFIGILFKLMVWKGGNTLLVIGLLAMLGPKIYGLFLTRTEKGESLQKYLKRLFLRYYIKAGVALIILLIPYKTIVAIYHRNDPEYVRLYNQYFEDQSNLQNRAAFFEHRRKVFKEEWKVKEYHDED